MERFTPDELLFEIPVYRSSPEERLRETDDLIAGVQEHADALAVDLPGQREVAEGYREARESRATQSATLPLQRDDRRDSPLSGWRLDQG
jgi:hypothetical protein